MAKPRFPLLARVVVALAATGLLPLAISFYQLRSNKDALADQVGRTHVVASRAASAQVDTYLEGMLTLARSNAAHPVLLSDPRSATAQELLSGTRSTPVYNGCTNAPVYFFAPCRGRIPLER